MEIHAVEFLVLIEARENGGHFAGMRVALRLNALRANLFHHALHRRVDGANGKVVWLHVRLENVVARAAHGSHHAVGADDNQAVGVFHANFRRDWCTEPTRSVGFHGLHDVADET